MGESQTVPIEVDVHAVKRMMESGQEMLLIDCREPGEYQIARIEGSVLIPMHEIPDRLAEIEPYRDTSIIVHCHFGRRSMQVVQWLRQQGFDQSQNMAKGIDAWTRFIDPLVPKYK